MTIEYHPISGSISSAQIDNNIAEIRNLIDKSR